MGDVPSIPHDWDRLDPVEMVAAFDAQHAFMMSCRREAIGLSRDGMTFTDPDLETFAARLLSLREEGYRFPDDVLDEVRKEVAEAASSRFPVP